jgi:hypothetical protein
MSSLSNLLNQENENVVYDPNELPQYSNFSNNINITYNLYQYSAQIGSFYNAFNPAVTNNPYGYTLECTVVDTYYTLADITNPKGGYLYFIVTPSSSNPNGPVTIKITVDGKVYEMVYNNTLVSIDTKYIIGDIMPSRMYNSTKTVWTADYTGESSSANSSTTSYLQNNRVDSFANYVRPFNLNGPLYTETHSPKLKFFNTLKVEVKTAFLDSDIDNNKTCAYIKTF